MKLRRTIEFLVMVFVVSSPRVFAEGPMSKARALPPMVSPSDFRDCRDDLRSRAPLDNFCPRMEGVHLEKCCPPIKKNPPITCTYFKLKPDEGYFVEHTYSVCVDPMNGIEDQITCCLRKTRACDEAPIVKTFIQRLIYRKERGNSEPCCFESCPQPEYWDDPALSGYHLKQQRATCLGYEENSCPGGLPECSGNTSNDHCPSTGGSSSSGTGGSSGTGSGGPSEPPPPPPPPPPDPPIDPGNE